LASLRNVCSDVLFSLCPYDRICNRTAELDSEADHDADPSDFRKTGPLYTERGSLLRNAVRNVDRAGVPPTVRRITNDESVAMSDYRVINRRNGDAARKKAEQHGFNQRTGLRQSFEGAEGAVAVHYFVTKTVTNSDGEPTGTEGNCHQFCDQIEGN
jgi:hypothetical protein